jgi:hypothetical protein
MKTNQKNTYLRVKLHDYYGFALMKDLDIGHSTPDAIDNIWQSHESVPPFWVGSRITADFTAVLVVDCNPDGQKTSFDKLGRRVHDTE